MEKKTMDYLVRDIPRDLHRQIKVRAAEEGITMREWIIRALEGALAERRRP